MLASGYDTALGLATFLVFNGFILISSFQFYVIIYYVMGGDEIAGAKWAGVAGTVGAVANFAIVAGMAWLGTKIGKRRALYHKMEYTNKMAAIGRLAAGVALAESLSASRCGLGLKWPNDLVWQGGKVGGILTELRAGGPGNATVVTGIGVNVSIEGSLDLGAESRWAQRPVDLKSVTHDPPDRELLAGTLVEHLYRAFRHFDEVGLAGFADRDPATLSGGQRARVALMRMLLAEPCALLLDEPFSRLDRARRDQVRQLVFDRARDRQLPVVMVTHDPEMAEYARRIVTVHDGLISSDVRHGDRRAAEEVA